MSISSSCNLCNNLLFKGDAKEQQYFVNFYRPGLNLKETEEVGEEVGPEEEVVEGEAVVEVEMVGILTIMDKEVDLINKYILIGTENFRNLKVSFKNSQSLTKEM